MRPKTDPVTDRTLTRPEGLEGLGTVIEIKADLFIDRSYVYFGYLIEDNEARMGFTVGQYMAQLEGDATYDHDFTDIPPMEMPDDPYYEPIRGVFASGNAGGTTLYRLREGIERFLITDINQPAASARAQSSVPVMWDYVAGNRDVSRFNHIPGGANVLYMDGHVEFIRYPGELPLTPWNVLMESYGQPGADNPGEG